VDGHDLDAVPDGGEFEQDLARVVVGRSQGHASTTT
jgi:hypothetical protein